MLYFRIDGYSTEDLTSVDPRSIQPDSQLFHCPAGDRNRANMSRLALQIDNSQVFLPLFQMFNSEINGFVATQTAGKQQRKKCTVSLYHQRARLLDELNVDPHCLVGSDRDPALCVATQ